MYEWIPARTSFVMMDLLCSEDKRAMAKLCNLIGEI